MGGSKAFREKSGTGARGDKGFSINKPWNKLTKDEKRQMGEAMIKEGWDKPYSYIISRNGETYISHDKNDELDALNKNTIGGETGKEAARHFTYSTPEEQIASYRNRDGGIDEWVVKASDMAWRLHQQGKRPNWL